MIRNLKMEMKIKYPIGIQTFAEIIEDKYLYVDKTKLIYDLVNDKKYVFLSRPRRFGKSLLMSTLDAYFKSRKNLFKGLAISEYETEWNSYPVFRFDLSSTNYDNINRVFARINNCLKDIEYEYGLTSTEDIISERFSDLIKQAYRKTGKKVVILIDEYDKPILDNLHNSEQCDQLRAELRGFYATIKACDEYVKFAMLTGITKFGKVSIFSGLNNLKDISLNPSYNSICGISETEFSNDFRESVKNFSIATGMAEEEIWKQFKELYDGYHFARTGENIYNPYSALNAFDDNRMGSYWYESGSSDYLVRLVETYSYNLDRLEGERRTEAELGNITDLRYDIVPLLYQAGYLTIKDYDMLSDQYTLGFPNREVYKAFWNSMARHFFRAIGGGNAFDLNKCLKDINEGRPEDFMTRLQALFADTSSETESNKEIR